MHVESRLLKQTEKENEPAQLISGKKKTGSEDGKKPTWEGGEVPKGSQTHFRAFACSSLWETSLTSFIWALPRLPRELSEGGGASSRAPPRWVQVGDLPHHQVILTG